MAQDSLTLNNAHARNKALLLPGCDPEQCGGGGLLL